MRGAGKYGKKPYAKAVKKPSVESVKRNILNELSDSISPISPAIDSAHTHIAQSPITDPSLTIDSAHTQTAQSPLTGPSREGQGDKSKIVVGSTVDLESIDSPLTERGGEGGAMGGAVYASTAGDGVVPLSLPSTPLQGSTPISWDDGIPTTESQPAHFQPTTQQDGEDYMAAGGERAAKNFQTLICQQRDQGFTDSAMDHTPASAKRTRTTDTPVKGQKASKITAVEINAEGESSTDSEQERTGMVKKASKAVDQSQQKQQLQQQPLPRPEESQQILQSPLIQLLLHRITVLEARAEHQMSTTNSLQLSFQTLEETSLNIFGHAQTRLDNHGERLVKAETNMELAMDSVEGVQKLTQRVAGTESDVATLHTAVNNHRSNLDRQMKDMERRFQEALSLHNPTTNFQEAAGSGPRRADQDVAFYITGILPLKAYLNLDPQADPTAPIIKLMKEWGQYSAIIRIMVADKQAGINRSRVNAVIVVMTSTFQKKTAVSNLKGTLKKANAKGHLKGVTIKDCFGTSAQPRARALTRYAGHLREQKDISGYRVINRQGEAHLQVYQGNSNWKDVHITDSDLDPYYMTKEERENGSAMEQEVAPSAPPPTQQQHSAYAPPRHPPTHPQHSFNSGGGAKPKTTTHNKPPTMHQHELHRREEARQREETRRMRSRDEESSQEEERRIERLEQSDEHSAAEYFRETARVKSAKAVIAAHEARHAAATNTSIRKTKGHMYTGKHKNSNC